MKHSPHSPAKTVLMTLAFLTIAILIPLSAMALSWQQATARTIQAETLAQEALEQLPKEAPLQNQNRATLINDTNRSVTNLPGGVYAPTPTPSQGNIRYWPTNTNLFGTRNSDPMKGFVEMIRQAGEDVDAKQDAIDEAKTALEEHYDTYIAGYQKQVDQLESRLDELQAQLKKRKDAKDRLVDMKLQMLTSQADGIGWPDGNQNTQRLNNLTTAWRSGSLNSSPFDQAQPVVGFARPSLANSNTAAIQSPFASGQNRFPSRTSTAVVPRKSVAPLGGSLASPISFKGPLLVGAELIEKGQSAKFLQKYLQPSLFLSKLEESSLKTLVRDFEKNDADFLAEALRVAAQDPVQRVSKNTLEVSWDVELEDKTRTKLVFVRENQLQSSWYMKEIPKPSDEGTSGR